VLHQLSARLRGLIRETDLLFRWGGEEFVVLTPHTGPGEARVLGERIRAAVAERPFAATEARPMATVTVSVGVAGSSDWPIDPNALLASADAACYKAKAHGRNQVTAA
jgi:diguanylate cyclase (GGDEF)-like protein